MTWSGTTETAELLQVTKVASPGEARNAAGATELPAEAVGRFVVYGDLTSEPVATIADCLRRTG